MTATELLRTKEPISSSFAVAVGKNGYCVLPEGGTHAPKHVAAHLMYVLIKHVHSVCITNGVR